jgi:ferredoxin
MAEYCALCSSGCKGRTIEEIKSSKYDILSYGTINFKKEYELHIKPRIDEFLADENFCYGCDICEGGCGLGALTIVKEQNTLYLGAYNEHGLHRIGIIDDKMNLSMFTDDINKYYGVDDSKVVLWKPEFEKLKNIVGDAYSEEKRRFAFYVSSPVPSNIDELRNLLKDWFISENIIKYKPDIYKEENKIDKRILLETFVTILGSLDLNFFQFLAEQGFINPKFIIEIQKLNE